MTNDNFWSDEMVCDFTAEYSVTDNFNGLNLIEAIQKFKESKYKKEQPIYVKIGGKGKISGTPDAQFISFEVSNDFPSDKMGLIKEAIEKVLNHPSTDTYSTVDKEQTFWQKLGIKFDGKWYTHPCTNTYDSLDKVMEELNQFNINKSINVLMNNGYDISKDGTSIFNQAIDNPQTNGNDQPKTDTGSKEYEVLKCISFDKKSIHPYQPLTCLGASKNVTECYIYSVKRLNDNKIIVLNQTVVKDPLTNHQWTVSELTTKDTRCFANGVNISMVEIVEPNLQPTPTKTYTEQDMRECFNASRENHMGITLRGFKVKTFEQYLTLSLPNNK